MIHTRLDGAQEAVVQEAPFSIRIDTGGGAGSPGSLPVGVAPVQFVTGTAENFFLLLRNISAAGQTIYIDTLATLTPANAGIVLYPGESVELGPMSADFYAIADAAGAELRTFVMST